MTATVTEPNTALDQLKVAQEALKGIDIRTLPRTGSTRDEIKQARNSVSLAIAALR